MFRQISNRKIFSFSPALVVLLAIVILAGASPQTLHAASDWDAKYWNNTDLSGDPVLHRSESDLNYDWGTGSPSSKVNSGNFSARWKRTINVTNGTYRFTATMDDGMRVWVDDVLLIDSWWDSQAHSVSADIYLTAGDHEVKVKYYEAGGQAVAKLHWTLVTSTPNAIYNWQGEYFNNRWLSGAPILVRDDRGIDFDWGGSSPAWGVVNADEFSVRWNRNVYLGAGRYRFTVLVDDGVRLWVNGQLLINQWHDSAATTYNGEIDISGGSIPIKMEYYENHGGSRVQLSWHQIGNQNIDRWRGEYFNNIWFGGSPVFVRDDADINFDWGYGTPNSRLHSDRFSVRWTRTLHFPAGTYRFTTTGDDGVRLWANGRLLIDKWFDQAAATYENNIYLSGDVPIQMEYYENSGLATARLSWTRVDGVSPLPPTPVPGDAVLVDDTDTGFVKGGSATAWHTAANGYGNHLTWTRNNDRMRAKYNWARWYPLLAPGRYEVYVHIPDRYSSTENARYWISHQGGYSLRTVNQGEYSGEWVSLGTYWFRGSSRDYVSLSDITHESYLSRLIAYDAVKWEPR